MVIHLSHVYCMACFLFDGYWTTRGYANARTGQLADVAGIPATSASCPVR